MRQLTFAVWLDLPVEVYEHIASYLPRSDIENMRLVSKKFEKNILAYLFRNVVVIFKPEIYGLKVPARGIEEEIDTYKAGIMLQDKGMLIFQG